MKLHQNVLALLLSVTVSCGFGQIYNFKNYTEDNGLSQAYIYQISQTSDGVIALSTGEGLVIYDGISFTTFTSKEVSDNFVANHFQDSRKVFWLGLSQGGAAYIRNKKIQFLKSEDLKRYKVTGIREDKKHQIWISCSGGFFVVDSLYRAQRVPLQEELAVNAFHFDAGGNILAATGTGLYVYEPATSRSLAVKGFEGKTVKQIVPVNNSGKLFWVLVEGEGIYGIEYTGNTYRSARMIRLSELHSQSNTISSIYADRTGNLWVSLFGEGLRKLTFSGKHYEKFNLSFIDERNGLPNLYVQSIFQDFEGNMWFGTFGSGLIEKPIEKFTFYNDKDGLKHTNIKKPVIDRTGMLWTASDQGLGCFHMESKSFRTFGAGNGFINGKVNTLFLDKAGLLWIGTAADGIYTLNTATLKFDHFSKKNHLPASTVHAISEGDGRMYFGTGDGLIVYNTQERSVKTLTTLDGLLHNSVVQLFYDSKKRLWISSHGSPPYCMKDTGFTFFKDIPDLKSFDINAVCEDQKGNIWIATEGDGVFRYDGKLFSNYKVSSGLLSNYCYGILADNSNSIWVTHKNGLSEKKTFLKEFHGIGAHDGLLFTENNVNAMYKDTIGDIWFGTTGGLIRYNSEIQKGNMTEPKISILRVQINKDVHRSESRIEQAYGFYPVRIDFLGVSFIDPEKIQYKFRLLGIDSLWKTTSANFVDYPNLGDGEYIFQVMARNSEGLWSSVPATVTILIREPLWKKPWFYAVLLALVIGLTYLIVQWRTNKLIKARKLLQDKVEEKTYLLQKEKEEVEKIKVELERHNKDITDSINYARRIQDSLLPPEELLNGLFKNNYFIFYKPKDIVSGDFYWAAPTTTSTVDQRSLSLAAVADCTGHGVPGAFLSIVATNFLKLSLSERDVNSPSQALDFLNVNITSSLNQSAKGRMRDGMDIALIAIDYERLELYYSGANNSIYIFRKSAAGTELIVHKATKRAIGAENENGLAYELKKIEVQTNDTIYLFSDGYADQFGGERDKKLNYKRFKDILMEACQLPISQQQKFVEKKFEDWRGTTEQTDDVCVMGIRI